MCRLRSEILRENHKINTVGILSKSKNFEGIIPQFLTPRVINISAQGSYKQSIV